MHCPGCYGRYFIDDWDRRTGEYTMCPGVTCPQCAEKEASHKAFKQQIRAAAQGNDPDSTFDTVDLVAQIRRDAHYHKEQCAEKEAEISRLLCVIMRQNEELDSCRNAVEKMRQAWMVANNDRKALRDLVDVGQLIVDANEVWPGKTVHTEEWRRLESKWRSLEGER